MKNRKFKYLKTSLLLIIVFVTTVNCDRELSEDATQASFNKTGEIFTDNFVGMGTNFYFPYGPDSTNPVGSKPTAWSVDTQVGYNSNASMRIDVPNASDIEGNYAGAILRIDGEGRNLTDYDALTFWVKSSQGVIISEFGFGEDFLENKYLTTRRNVTIGTSWSKIIIPIANASLLLQERGMFRYSANTEVTNGFGYSFWIDDLKFEKLGTIANGTTSIKNGNNVSETTFVGVQSLVDGIKATYSMPNGTNQDISISPAHVNFISSDPSVASVDSSGRVTSLSAGTAVITAKFGTETSLGSLTINCVGAYVNAPIPNKSPANVISIFSDAYTNVPVNYFNGYWQPWQTTVSNDFSVQGDHVLNYTIFNFVGIEFSSPTVNATSMTHLHLDAYIPGPIDPGRQLRVLVVDFGANGTFQGGDDTRHSTTFTATTPTALVSQNWISIDIPFSEMPTLASRSHLAQLILEGGDGSLIYIDNIYFYN